MALDLSQLRRLFGNNSGQRMTMSPPLLELSEEEDERLANLGKIDPSDVSITTPGLLAPDLPEPAISSTGIADSILGRVNQGRLRANKTPFASTDDAWEAKDTGVYMGPTSMEDRIAASADPSVKGLSPDLLSGTGMGNYLLMHGELPRGPIDDFGEPLSAEAARDLQRLPEATEEELAVTESLSPTGGLLQTDTTTAGETVSEGPQIPEIPLFMKDAANQVQEQAGPELPAPDDLASFADTIRKFESFRTTPYIDWSYKDGKKINTGLAVGFGQHKYWPEAGPPVDVTEDMDFTDQEWLDSADRQLKREVVPGLRKLLPPGKWEELPPEAQAQLVSVAWNYGVNHRDFKGDRPIAVALREGDWDAMGDAIRDLASDNINPDTGQGANYDRRNAEADAFEAAMAGGGTDILGGFRETLSGFPVGDMTPQQAFEERARQRMAEGEDKSLLFGLITWKSQALPDIDKWADANGTWEEFSQIRKDKIAAGDRDAAIRRWNAANPKEDTTRGGLLREERGGFGDEGPTDDQLKEVGYIPPRIPSLKEQALRLAAESESVYDYLQSEIEKGAFDWNDINLTTLRDIRNNDPNLGQESPDADIEGWEGIPMALPGQEGATGEGSTEEGSTDEDPTTEVGEDYDNPLNIDIDLVAEARQAGLLDSRAVTPSAVPGSQSARPQRRGLFDDRLAIAQALAQLSAGVAQGGLFGDITDSGNVRGGLVNVMPDAIKTLRDAQNEAVGDAIPESNWGIGPAQAEQLFYIGPGGAVTWATDSAGNYVLKKPTGTGTGGRGSGGEKQSMARALTPLAVPAAEKLINYYSNIFDVDTGQMIDDEGNPVEGWERSMDSGMAAFKSMINAPKGSYLEENYKAAQHATGTMGEVFLRLTTGAAYNQQEYGNAMNLFWVKHNDPPAAVLHKLEMVRQFGPMIELMSGLTEDDQAFEDAIKDLGQLREMRKMLLSGAEKGYYGDWDEDQLRALQMDVLEAGVGGMPFDDDLLRSD